ncbi:MAG: ribosome silencing factor [Proteobacteria bacterium]|nr:ribosome silencing factor [Pseudomonadota bacterium]
MNSKQLSALIIDVLGAAKAIDIINLDVRDMTTVTDYMIVASGTSTRHVRALVDYVAEKASKSGHKPIGVEGEEGGEWVLLDLQDVLVHVMLPRVREFYNLEKLWSLGPSIELASVGNSNDR